VASLPHPRSLVFKVYCNNSLPLEVVVEVVVVVEAVEAVELLLGEQQVPPKAPILMSPCLEKSRIAKLEAKPSGAVMFVLGLKAVISLSSHHRKWINSRCVLHGTPRACVTPIVHERLTTSSILLPNMPPCAGVQLTLSVSKRIGVGRGSTINE
jgi:hypothetical protein